MRVAVCSKPGLCDHTAIIARVALAAVTAEERDWPAKIRTSWRLTLYYSSALQMQNKDVEKAWAVGLVSYEHICLM